MADSPLRVAIAGLGFGEKVHVPALRDCPSTEPVALWHPRPERLEAAAQATGLPGHSSFERLLADPTIDAIVIATPPEPRFALAQAALAAGKHLLLEKPVALNADQVESLQRQAMARNLTVAVDFEYRAVPLFQQLAALLQQGVTTVLADGGRDLGGDVQAARRRAKAVASRRLTAARQRAWRVSRLFGKGGKAAQLTRTGVLPQAT